MRREGGGNVSTDLTYVWEQVAEGHVSHVEVPTSYGQGLLGLSAGIDTAQCSGSLNLSTTNNGFYYAHNSKLYCY